MSLFSPIRMMPTLRKNEERTDHDVVKFITNNVVNHGINKLYRVLSGLPIMFLWEGNSNDNIFCQHEGRRR